ncbi:MAG: glycosyltransferase [Flavobacteriales bacterium]
MRIAYLSTFHPFRGGIAQFNAALYRTLEREHQVKAYTFTRQYPEFLFPGKTQLVTPDDSADAVPSQRVLDTAWPPSWYGAARTIAKDAPELLIMKFWMSYFGPSLGTVAGQLQKRGTKVLTVLDNVLPHERRIIDLPFTKYFLNRNHGFIAMSEKVKRDLLSLRPDAPVHFMPHPLYDHFGASMPREEAARKLGIDPTLRTVLFFGLIRDYKGLDLLIEAFAQLGEGYQLVIAGEPYGDFAPYQKMIDVHPLRHRITAHARYIADTEVPAFFSAADCLVLPYKSATQSGITAIAFHFGVPVIATDVGGLAEIVEHERTGLIVPKPDATAIAEGIKLYFTGDRSQRLRGNFAQVKQELSWDRFSEGLVKFAETL